MKCLCLLLLAVAGGSLAQQFSSIPGTASATITGFSVGSLGVGGGAGCVVAGDTLFVNGIRSRELNADELAELEQYKREKDVYTKTLRDRLEARAVSTRRRLNAAIREFGVSSDEGAASEKPVLRSSAQPKRPTRPSFCKPEDTVQYVFEGCVVQGNKVFVGRELARELTTDEQQQLRVYADQMKVFKEAAQRQITDQLNQVFSRQGGIFGELFRLAASDLSGDETGSTAGAASSSPQRVSSTASTSPASMPEPPVAPDFCVAIH